MSALGKVESVVDSLNNRQEFTYDSMGRNTVVRDALNNTSTAEYDKLGNVTKLVGPLGGATNYSYDQMGILVSESTSSGGTITYGYNALNIKEQLTNERGQSRKYFYDAMGRITGFVGAEDSVSYTYDDNGNVLTVSDKNGVIKREYDALNRIIKLTDTFGKTIQYTYDAVGNLASIIYPDNTAVSLRLFMIMLSAWYLQLKRQHLMRLLPVLSIPMITCRKLSRKNILQKIPKYVILMIT